MSADDDLLAHSLRALMNAARRVTAAWSGVPGGAASAAPGSLDAALVELVHANAEAVDQVSFAPCDHPLWDPDGRVYVDCGGKRTDGTCRPCLLRAEHEEAPAVVLVEGQEVPCCPHENYIHWMGPRNIPGIAKVVASGWFWCEGDGEPGGYSSESRVKFCPECGRRLPKGGAA